MSANDNVTPAACTNKVEYDDDARDSPLFMMLMSFPRRMQNRRVPRFILLSVAVTLAVCVNDTLVDYKEK